MVGTSIFENYMEANKKDYTFKNYFDDLRDRDSNQYKDEQYRVNYLKREINNWLHNDKRFISNASAEIKSIEKLKEFYKDNFEIYLLASDTILSKLAGEIIKENLNQKFEKMNIYLEGVEDLQVKDSNRFKTGMQNLINKIYSITNEYFGNVVINITGGYKATIPYLTILGQVSRCPLYYIFENTNTLIEIPYIPIDLKWDLFEKHEAFFARLEMEEVSEIKGGNEDDYNDVMSLLEKADDMYALNPLGIVLWERYKQRYSIFYISEIAKSYIESDPNYKRIAEKSFIELKRRISQNPEDPDLNHKLSGVDFKDFKVFKHKEENLQIRILYTTNERNTRYATKEIDIYIGLLRIGSDVHNVENEYVKDFENNRGKIDATDDYKSYRIEKERK